MELQNIKIAGSGSIAGGEYNIISIAGAASSSGDIKSKVLKVAGAASFHGEVDSNEVSLAGSNKFLKHLKGNKIKMAGAVKIEGNLSAEEVKSEGALKVVGECNVGTLNHKGKESKFNNIYGETIILKSKGGSKITVNEIEATNIQLKSIEAKRVSGDNLQLEGKCVIDIIEFRNNLKLSKHVVVNEIIKL